MQLIVIQSRHLIFMDQTYQHNLLALLMIKLYWFYVIFSIMQYFD